MSDYTVYIDEAGDLGINRGTKWFVLTAVIVAKEAEPKIRENIKQIKTKLNLNELHFRKIKDFNKRSFIVRELSEETFIYMNVLVDTSKFDEEKIPNSIIAYNYVCKYLLQRASWYLRDIGGIADIVLSARGTARDGELIDYIQNKLIPYDYNRIHSGAFERVSAKTASTWDLLQLADICATSMFFTYEINGFGFCLPCFTSALAPHLYTVNNKLDSYGIKYFTNAMKPDVDDLKSRRICLKA